MFKKILCSTDGLDHSAKALDLAIDMAQKNDAALVLLHVLHQRGNMGALQRYAEIAGLANHANTELQRLQSMDDRINLAAGSAFQESGISPRLLVEVGQRLLDGAQRKASEGGVKNVVARLGGGDPADSILRCIDEENIDCVIMGSRGLNDLKSLFLGSVSHKVTNRAPCTCIAVK